jgi:hypothetical protein
LRAATFKAFRLPVNPLRPIRERVCDARWSTPKTTLEEPHSIVVQLTRHVLLS